MSTRIQKESIDHGFGFPVRLRNVPMVRIRGIWTPDVDYNELARAVLRALCFKPVRLTGNEIRFIRLQAEMTLQQFAERFCVTHPSVMKWEKQGDEATRMMWSTEKDVRLFALLMAGGEEELAELYRHLVQQKPARKQVSSVDVAEMAA